MKRFTNTIFKHLSKPLVVALLAVHPLKPMADYLEGDANEPADKPNIIVIFIDDMGWGDLSSFGSKVANTPAIDQLAKEGMAFEQYYVNSPVCSPSRIALSTGQYPLRWGITSYLDNRATNAKRGIQNWLDPKAPMLARSLKKAGYATGHFGKWHMGGQRDVDDAPPITDYGFDQSLTNFEGMGPKLLPLTRNGRNTFNRTWRDAERLGPYMYMQRSRITTGFIDAAIGFIDRAADDGKPFYVNIWPDDVHGPWWPPAEDYNIANSGGRRGLYLAVLESMDRQFEALFDYIRQDKRLQNNTLILFASDNGPDPGIGDANGLKGYKAHLYEGGIRSPLIVWGPAFMAKDVIGSRNKDSVFSSIDIVPSLLEFADAELVEGVSYDGENLLKTLLGKSQASRKQPLFFNRLPDRHIYKGITENYLDLAVRSGKWKLLCKYDGSEPQLYDLLTDPGESNNVSETHPKKTRALVKEVISWYQNTKR
ncbi:sulfatase-like hydrolase/transferase [Porticoccus sp. W117]|uniref:sulfatase-like hydrolase/transferase n=1 Tax=Porticoccus sp. W117 TaxID=3054777 RepID=UPI002594E53E|nr:sulfatase-like hydrolase/transferase [Porticoccus sp. W117]MDM3870065.1 sulfatase-like hydrolase/transferase [Porticoccus sp. W117]